MRIPDFRHVPKKLFDTGLFDLKTHHGQGAFVDACVCALHGLDENFGHLKKKPGQTQVHGHGEDATLYKFDDGTAQAVDFIAGAGGPNPQPGWGVDSNGPIYKHADWLDPTLHVASAPPPPPPVVSFPYPDESSCGRAFQERIRKAYQDAGRRFPDANDHDGFRHFVRYGYSAHEMPEAQAADKHVAELRAQLGV
ncbi:MAG TPA: hypothetical protein VF239_02425 [Vicinamibacterales bacterium]|jgi:hypothetical protein